MTKPEHADGEPQKFCVTSRFSAGNSFVIGSVTHHGHSVVEVSFTMSAVSALKVTVMTWPPWFKFTDNGDTMPVGWKTHSLTSSPSIAVGSGSYQNWTP